MIKADFYCWDCIYFLGHGRSCKKRINTCASVVAIITGGTKVMPIACEQFVVDRKVIKKYEANRKKYRKHIVGRY
jgi:hypothetical protein